ncbi:MAG TPA: adenine deaminase [Dehalococcoidia bacterium]|nr:adenine deaminase [Dehalococcoidia bacterium]
MSLARLVAVASGRAPADLLLVNARVVNTLNGRIEGCNVAICDGQVAGLGDYLEGNATIDLENRYLVPGLIDGHIHIESSMLLPGEYVRAVAPRGVLAAVTDLHEIANVGGLGAVRTVMDWCAGLPFELFFMVPSCVPASHLETSGATITADDIKRAKRWKRVVGLGEMMNFPGVINAGKDVLGKMSLFRGGVIDGHAPGVSGKALNAYVVSGAGSDHECTTLEEAREKLSRGMHIMIREGSSEKNLEALLPVVDDSTYGRCFFVVDDRSCVDLLADGDVDAVVRKAIASGLDPVRSIQMATVNTARYFGLRGLGAIAPGYDASFFVVDDLTTLKADMVFHRGLLIARSGEMITKLPHYKTNELSDSVKVKRLHPESLRIRTSRPSFPVIEVIPGQIVTAKRLEKVDTVDGFVVTDVGRDILKLAVVERHRRTGNVGVGLVEGFGLRRGALASSVAHDSHNIIVVGCSDEDIMEAIKEVERLHGGLVVCDGGKVVASMALPIAGLISDKPLRFVAQEFSKVDRAAHELGARLPAPFATLSFLALPVIPELKLTDLGLVDVAEFRLLGSADLE